MAAEAVSKLVLKRAKGRGQPVPFAELVYRACVMPLRPGLEEHQTPLLPQA